MISKRYFDRSVNSILGKVLSTATVDVVLHLINSKCVPVLLHGLELCSLNRADMQSLDFCINRPLMKLCCTNNLSTVEECRHFRLYLVSRYRVNSYVSLQRSFCASWTLIVANCCLTVQLFIYFYLVSYFFVFWCYHFWWIKDCHSKSWKVEPMDSFWME